MELRGHRRANKPQSGFFSRHYFNGRVVSDRLPLLWDSSGGAFAAGPAFNWYPNPYLTVDGMKTDHSGYSIRRRIESSKRQK